MRSDSDVWEIEDSPQGQFVKFDDVMEFLKPTANTGSPKLPTLEETLNEMVRIFGIKLSKRERLVTKMVYDYMRR
jgi:hypothetical protein